MASNIDLQTYKGQRSARISLAVIMSAAIELLDIGFIKEEGF